MNKPPHDAVIVSPAATLGHILIVSACRALLGMGVVLWIVGKGALPIVVPGVAAFVTCVRGGWDMDARMARLGLCLSSSMWVGAAAAVVAQYPSKEAIFLAAAITSFALTDVMLATMRMERVP
jgi:hypothetical protein